MMYRGFIYQDLLVWSDHSLFVWTYDAYFISTVQQFHVVGPIGLTWSLCLSSYELMMFILSQLYSGCMYQDLLGWSDHSLFVWTYDAYFISTVQRFHVVGPIGLTWSLRMHLRYIFYLNFTGVPCSRTPRVDLITSYAPKIYILAQLYRGSM